MSKYINAEKMTKEEAIQKMNEMRRLARTCAQEVAIITSDEFERLKKIAYGEPIERKKS